MARMARALTGVVVATTGVMMGGCRPVLQLDLGNQTRGDADRIKAKGLAIEYATAIDRVTFFGPEDGPNLLYVTRMDEQPRDDGTYTFFGGVYTWVSPQNGEMGWRGADGAASAWPPDPAMDVGPALRVSRTRDSITTRTPPSRSGLVEQKTLTITGERSAELRYTIRNVGTQSVMAGAWVNSAVSAEHLIAVRMPAGSELWAWNNERPDRMAAVMSQPGDRGWSLINLSEYRSEGGTKYYMQSATLGGEGPGATPEIAVWSEGWWLHRKVVDWAPDAASMLRSHGEGPVAVYIQPADPVIEAELYGPMANLSPGMEITTTEVWTLIPSEKPDLSVLP